MSAPSRARALTGSLLLAVTLAACGGQGGLGYGAPATPAQGSAAATPGQSATTSATTASPVTVRTATSALGTILVDGRGMTLYLFTKDTRGSGASSCEGACLAAWPPLRGRPTAGAGVDPALIGTLTRSDGTTQVTYHGWPLYYWAQDTAPGDTSGQGVSNVWWVLDPAGDPIGAANGGGS